MTKAWDRDGVRRVFAMAALTGLLSDGWAQHFNNARIAGRAVAIADALMVALEAEPQDEPKGDHKVDLMGRPVRP